MEILLAEDEGQLFRALVAAMKSVSYDVDAALNGRGVVELAKKNSYDVTILDIMMPIMDGITALKQIRKSGGKTYVLMLTAKAEIDGRVIGLDSGADDYLTKLFSLKELLVRLRSKERRDDQYTPSEVEVGDLALNASEQELVSHNSIRLGSKETQLLNYLMLNEGKKFSASDLLARVWKDENDANKEVVWIHISYLRQKLQSIQSSVQTADEKSGGFLLIK